ncbi:MAG: YafY family protein [Pseudomonadota bacterium]
MKRSERMFEIIQLLHSSTRSLTAQQIANELDVTKRTIYRDIVALQAMRVPIDGEAGVGYLMRPGFDLPPLMFTPEEVEAIAVGLSLLGRTGDDGLQNAAASVVRKISNVLPPDNPYGLISQSIFTSKWHSIPRSVVDPSLLREAIRKQQKISIEYRDANEHISHRTILPLVMLYYVDALVLAAWCELREDFRHFRVDRISRCGTTGQYFDNNALTLREKWESKHQLQQ